MEKESKLYEIGYLLNPVLAEEAVADEVNAIRGIIEKNGGAITSEEKAKAIKLAYTIKKTRVGKFETAHFGWIRFFAEPESVVAIKNDVDKMENVIRFLIVIASEEQMAVMAGKRTYTKKEEKPEDKQHIQVEEVDKKIEELISSSQ